jgi:hypothetical protein
VAVAAGVVAVAGCTGDGGGPAAGGAGGGPAAVRTVRWATCAVPAGRSAVVQAVAPGGDGVPWLAVGQTGTVRNVPGVAGDVRPAVWAAADGCAWRPVPVAPATPDGERTGFLGVARFGRTVAALGRSYSEVHGNIRPTLWQATGTAPLREVELPRELFGGPNGIAMTALGATGDGFVAVGAFLVHQSPAVQLWRSADGRAWQRPAPPAALVSTAGEQLHPQSATIGPDGVLVVGTAWPLHDQLRDGADGAAWVAGPAVGGPATGGGARADTSAAGLTGLGDQELLGATRLPGGYVAVGSATAGDARGLVSALSVDGRGWTRGGPLPLATAVSDSAAMPPPTAVVPVPAGGALAAMVVAGHQVRLWRSPTGQSWTPEALPPGVGTGTGVVAASGGGRLVLVVQTTGGPLTFAAR